MASGIFCGDPARLSILATMPHLRVAEATHGGLLRAVLAERTAASRGSGGPRPGLASPRTGMSELAESLTERLAAHESVTVHLDTRLTSLRRDGAAYAVTLSTANGPTDLTIDAIVLAVPTAATADILAMLDADEPVRILRAMTVESTITVSLGYVSAGLPDLDRALPAHGYLIAEPGRGPVRSVTRTTTKFPGRAPEGHELFRVAVRSDDDVADDDLVRLAREELGRTLGIGAEPVLAHVQRWTRVMPQYAVGHLDRVAEVEQQLSAFPAIRLAGSGAYGLGIPDCVASAERAVDALLPVLA